MAKNELKELADTYSRTGDKEIFVKLLEASWNALYRQYKPLFGHNNAEEIAGETVARVLVRLDGDHAAINTSFVRYLFRAAENISIDMLRKRRPHYYAEVTSPIQNSGDDSYDPVRKLLAEEGAGDGYKKLLEKVDQVLGMLTPQTSETARKIILEQQTTEQVAAELGVTRDTVRARVSLAKKRLCASPLLREYDQGFQR